MHFIYIYITIYTLNIQCVTLFWLSLWGVKWIRIDNVDENEMRHLNSSFIWLGSQMTHIKEKNKRSKEREMTQFRARAIGWEWCCNCGKEYSSKGWFGWKDNTFCFGTVKSVLLWEDVHMQRTSVKLEMQNSLKKGLDIERDFKLSENNVVW